MFDCVLTCTQSQDKLPTPLNPIDLNITYGDAELFELEFSSPMSSTDLGDLWEDVT